jgi:hypothetical protein
MGYSARYHVASLAAIFLALGVGILIGTGLGKNVISATTKRLEQSLRGDLDSARSQAASLREELRSQQQFAAAVYPALTDSALRGARVAVIALGGLDSALRGDIERVLGPGNHTGARIREFAVVREPADLGALTAALRGSGLPRPRKSSASLDALGRRAAGAIVAGGPLFRRASGALLARRSGRPAGIDAVVVVRSAPAALGPRNAAATAGLEGGLLDGLKRTGLPVVGVERSDADPSSIGLYRTHDLATVDDLDESAGAVSAVYALRGAVGSFGSGPEATRLLPALGRVRRQSAGRVGVVGPAPGAHPRPARDGKGQGQG